MRSILVLVVGFIAGAVVGEVATSRFKNEAASPIEEPRLVKVEKKPPQSSPFAPVEDSVALDNQRIKKTDPSTGQSVSSSVAITQTQAQAQAQIPAALPAKPLTDIWHFREIMQVVQFIDTADSDELELLLLQLQDVGGRSAFAGMLNAAIYQRWAEIDLDEALDYVIESLSNRRGQYSQWTHEALSLLARENPDAVRDRIELIKDDSMYSEISHAVYAGIAASDPERLVRQAMLDTNNGRDPRRVDMLSVAVTEWAAKDPAAAWDFLQAEGDEQIIAMYRDQILYTWLARDPDSAIIEVELALSTSKNPDEQMMLSDLYVSHLSRTDPAAAYQWVRSQKIPGMEDALLSQVIYTWGETDPAGLESFITQLGPADSSQVFPMAISIVAGQKARTDPLGAMAWAEQFGEAQAEEAKMSIVSEWVYTDPHAATDWLFSLPATTENEQLIYSVSGSLMHADPDTAKIVFDRLPPTMQAEYAQSMAFTLAQQDPQIARQWLNDQPNPEVRQVGMIFLDSMDPDADTGSILDRIATLQVGDRQSMLFDAVSKRSMVGGGIEEIQQWLLSTNLLSEDERAELSSMLEDHYYGGPEGTDFYMRHQRY